MENERVIHYKRYGNRRIYNPSEKCYVTFNDISEKIKDGFTVVVTDQESKKDITTQILTQIVLQNWQNMLSSELLHQMIKIPQYLIKDYLEEYLKVGIQAYMDFFQQLKEQRNRWLKIGLPMMDEKTKEVSLEMAKKFFDQFIK
ncbi:MAG TPA: polyhydroxyalkanoate synthesis regulator DNA-binding domain-containing protein [Thermodesulfovibrionia bacterium]|nr:polyhydroxyalkanoate synthesis regulator DNA-binding domain-containing protein [Thermodesulfovibrionia bacterium]